MKSKLITYNSGNKHWYNEKYQYHREGGPAVEFPNGDKQWFINGQLHRLDGPAIEYSNGDKQWYINDYLHRLIGPAAEWANGKKEWRINLSITYDPIMDNA